MMNTSSSRYPDVGKLCHPSDEFKGIHLLGGIIANIPIPQFSKGGVMILLVYQITIESGYG